MPERAGYRVHKSLLKNQNEVYNQQTTIEEKNMHPRRSSITVAIVVLVLLAGCRPAAAPPASTAAPPTPITTATTPSITVVATLAPTATPIPTTTPEPGLGTVLLIFGQQFIYDIYSVVRPALEEAGYTVVVASRSAGPLLAKNVDQKVQVDLLLKDVHVEDYAAILFNCDNDITFGSARAETNRIAQEAVAQNKVLAAICSGPRVLAYADVVKGLQTTGEPSQTCAMLEQSGATCTGAEIERDGLIITARDRYASHAYVLAIIEAIQKQSAAPPLDQGDEGLIAFVSTRDGNGEIYTVNADGSNPRRLTNYREWDGFPTWSPDGTQIAYYSYLNAKNWVIKIMDADGSNVRRLTDNGACDGAPSWSPDGTKIAFNADADCTAKHREVYVIDADGSNQRNLTNHDADDVHAVWSPDETQIAFSSNRDGNYEIYVMAADGSHPIRLTHDAHDDYVTGWSPNSADSDN